MPPLSPKTKSTKIKPRKPPYPAFTKCNSSVLRGRNINLTVLGQAKHWAPLDRMVVVRQIMSFFPSRATPVLRKWSVGGKCLKELPFIHRLSQIHCALSAFCFQKGCEITCSLDKNLPAGWLPIHQILHSLCCRPSQVFWSLGSCALTSVLFLL